MAEQAVADTLRVLTDLQGRTQIDQAAQQVAVQHRADATQRESNIKAKVYRIDKANADDKVKLRRWIRDIDLVHAEIPDIARDVAARTSQGNLADALETYYQGHLPRNDVTWPQLRTYVQDSVLGTSYEKVFRKELTNIRQTPHESVNDYSERFLQKAKDAYPEPWVDLINESLIATYARGLEDRKLADEVTILVAEDTLRATIIKARAVASTREALAAEVGRDRSLIANVHSDPPHEIAPVAIDKLEAKSDDMAKLVKQVASLSSRVGELKKGTSKPPPGPLKTCWTCGRTGHFSRDCREATNPAIECWTCGRLGHMSRDCRSGLPRSSARGRGTRFRGRGRGRGGPGMGPTYEWMASNTTPAGPPPLEYQPYAATTPQHYGCSTRSSGDQHGHPRGAIHQGNGFAGPY